jgi:serine/threonine-protein kinase
VHGATAGEAAPRRAPRQTVTATEAHPDSPAACTSSAGLVPGDILAGRYRIERCLAGGGMGEVYAAEDALLSGPVAVKLLRPELLHKPGAQDRCAEEIRIARRVTHPNVCRVFDVGLDGERMFFTMERHSGATLAGLLHRTGAMDAAAAAPFVRQLLDGVAAAHAVGVVHLSYSAGASGSGAAPPPSVGWLRPSQRLRGARVGVNW